MSHSFTSMTTVDLAPLPEPKNVVIDFTREVAKHFEALHVMATGREPKFDPARLAARALTAPTKRLMIELQVAHSLAEEDLPLTPLLNELFAAQVVAHLRLLQSMEF